MDSANEKSEDPFEVAASLSEEDWKRLERCINSNTMELTLTLAALTMTSSLLIAAVASWLHVSMSLGLVMFIPGGAIFYAGWKMSERSLEDRHLLNWLLYEELTLGVRILPEWFRIEDKLLSTAPYREPPEHTGKEWEKLIRATRNYGKRFLLVFVPFMIIVAVILMLPSLLGVTFHWVLFAMTLLMWFVTIYSIVNVFRAQKISKMMAMERLTGKEIIPERHRARIGKTWLRMETKFEEELDRDCREP